MRSAAARALRAVCRRPVGGKPNLKTPARRIFLGLVQRDAGPMNANPNSQVLYIETSIRPGLTIDQYRRSRPQRPSRWERLKNLAGGAQPATA